MNRHTVGARFRKLAAASGFAAPLPPSPASAHRRLHEAGRVHVVRYLERTRKLCGVS